MALALLTELLDLPHVRVVGYGLRDEDTIVLDMAEAIVDLGLRHSKIARFAQPPVKEIK